MVTAFGNKALMIFNLKYFPLKPYFLIKQRPQSGSCYFVGLMIVENGKKNV
jgi:hypothetical protein